MNMNHLVESAIIFATGAHLGQRDHGGFPYILHPLRVMLDVQRQGGSVNAQIAAVLHDVVEDTAITAGEVFESFGADVAELVAYLTQDPDQETHKAYIERLRPSKEATMIKLADLRDNMDPDRPTKAFGLQKRYAQSYYRLKFDLSGEKKDRHYPQMPPPEYGETDEQYTNRVTGADGKGGPYDHHRWRNCSMGYHADCMSASREDNPCVCPCHAARSTLL